MTPEHAAAPQPTLTIPYGFRTDAPSANPGVVPESVRAAQAAAAGRAPRTSGAITERLKVSAQSAMDVIEDLLSDSNTDPLKKKDIAVWLLEKATGKPKQEFEHNSGTLSEFLALLEAQARGGGPKVRPALPAGESDAPDIEAEFTDEDSRTDALSAECEEAEDDAARWVRENT